MTPKTLALSAVLVVASFFAGWALKPPGTAEVKAPHADRHGRTVSYDEYQALKTELDRANAKRDLVRSELDEIQRELGKKSVAAAGEGTDGGEAKIEGPRFVYGGMVEALNGLDWDVIGTSMSQMPPVLARLSQALAEGKKFEDLADEIGLIQQLNGPLVAEALKMSKSGIEGTGLNGIFTHPSVMANMVHAALTKADLPLTEEQERLVYEIGLRFTEEDRQRLASYDEGAFGMEKLVGEADLRDRFFAEVYRSLTPEQRERIRPEGVKGYTNVDLFSTGVLYGPLTRPLPFHDRASLEKTVAAQVGPGRGRHVRGQGRGQPLGRHAPRGIPRRGAPQRRPAGPAPGGPHPRRRAVPGAAHARPRHPTRPDRSPAQEPPGRDRCARAVPGRAEVARGRGDGPVRDRGAGAAGGP
jgi:hypothetical protein